jgi:glycosyltransferase involved in cell wall biosynthesis
MKEGILSDLNLSNNKIIAVIPAHNEEKYIFEVVKKAKQYVNEVIVVNDNSYDNTANIARNAGAMVITHDVNLGLGATLKTGCEAALILGANVIITLDGDGQHDPDEIPILLKKLYSSNSDFVLGERPFDNNMPIVKKVGNIFFQRFSKQMFQMNFNDTQSGYRVFTIEAYKKIKWDSMDYKVASEILINVKKHNINHSSEEIKTIYHENQKGTTPIDGLKIAYHIIKMRLKN